MTKIMDMIGYKAGRLTVTGFAGRRDHRTFWSVSCECGGSSVVCGARLRGGGVRSCGCLMRETAKKTIKANVKHRWPEGRTPAVRGPRLIHEMTQAELHRVLDYEPVSGAFTWKESRGGKTAGEPAGKPARSGYRKISVLGKQYFEHRLVWLYVHGVWPPEEIDHINGVTGDNRLVNLRAVDRTTNAQNQRTARRDSRSGFMGVRAVGKKWVAHIGVDGKSKWLGTFSTPEAAHEAYVAAKAIYHPGFVERIDA